MDSLSVGIRVPSINCNGATLTRVNTDPRNDLLSRMPSFLLQRVAGIRFSWLRVSGTAKMPQIDQGASHQLHAVMSLLLELETQQQPFEFILPREGPLHA
jgi:hypothetical protein